MEQKLPAFFEKYFEEKFGSLTTRFDEKFDVLGASMKTLKCHVNDEVQLIRKTVQKLEKGLTRLYWIVAVVFITFVICNSADINFVDLFIKLFLK